jgi:hypothetical protein
MNNPFPEKSVAYFRQISEEFAAVHPKYSKNKFNRAFTTYDYVNQLPYRFIDHLFQGNYSPYPHECRETKILGVNCTSIIPHIYILAEIEDLDPQIVEFVNCSDVVKHRVSDYPPMEAKGHYGVVVDIGREHKFLLDPTMTIFGPILEETENIMRIGKCRGFLSATRTFDRAIYHTAEEFVKMYEELREPAKSLDVLAAGVKVFNSRKIAKVDCSLMLFYDDDENKILTRLYIPQVNISDKVVFGNIYMNDEGDVATTTLDLLTARAPHWDSLLRPRAIGRTNYKEMATLRRQATHLGKKKKNRLGPLLLDADASNRSGLIEIVNEIESRMLQYEKDKIRRQILMRTLYECVEPESRFISTDEEQDARIIKLWNEEARLLDKKEPISRTFSKHSWKIQRLSRNEGRRLKRKLDRVNLERQKVSLELNKLIKSRYDNEDVYRRTQDMILFAQKKAKHSTDDLQKEVENTNLDTRIGRIAMFHDYIPFVFEGRKDIELSLFMDPIKQKVKARHQKQQVMF